MSDIRKYPFLTAYEQTSSMYGIEMSEDQFLTYAYTAYEQIGNIDTELKRMILCPKEESYGRYCVDLPCDLTVLDSVTIPTMDCIKSTNKHIGTVGANQMIESNIENNINRNQDYAIGTFIEYDRYGDKLMVYESYPQILITYKSEILGDDDLPMLNSKEVDAVTKFCIYAHLNKQGLMTRDANMIQLAMSYRQMWNNAKMIARSPEYLNQNEIDTMLNSVSSSDRKIHNVSYKIVK